ncbi:hypothetical protein WMY93_013754 [Mugilogobius chulae]|uniref:Uncharacterized protein n=1 Tax=Mugilogobius chulae TaxID=88201 RepID=A0AAW0P0X7_9GOBI
MGQSPSTDCSDMSDTADSEQKDSNNDEEGSGELNVDEEEEEDTKACDSAFPPLLIEGLHEGEPPPHTNTLEQNQETAGRDYALEQQWGLTPDTGCNSGNCSGISTGEEYVQCTEDTTAEISQRFKAPTRLKRN